MSHSLGTVAVSPDGSAYVNDIVIRRNLPIPASDSRTYLHATHGGANDRLEVYVTQGESTAPADCTILGKYVFREIQPTDEEVAVDVGLSYDSNGVVQVRAIQRDTGGELPMAVEPVPDDLSWLGRPPVVAEAADEPGPIRVLLLIDGSASMTGQPLEEAQTAAREFLAKCDFTTTEVGLISFSTIVALQAAATSNVRRLHAAIHRLEAGGSTNLTDALEMARGELVGDDRRRVHRHPDRRLSRRRRERGRAGGRGASGRHRDRGDRHGRCRPRLPPATGQQRSGLDLRQDRRAGADLRAHRPRDRRGRARLRVLS